ncbi:MAG: RNA-binding protein [Dehalococcoidia bacterium]|nr:RNA-binding protein [Dehalococcoidia bacterium]
MNIYVGNLPLELTVEELRKEFLAFGQVKSVNIMDDRDIGSGQPRGYGFVEMPLESEGSAAIISLVGKIIRGRLIEIIEALPLSDEKDKISFNRKRVSRFNTKRQRGY